MNAELLLRLTHMKQYITSLNDSLSLNDTAHASATVSRFKKSMNKSDQHVHASQFVLDCLKTRNEKLRNQLLDMQEEKKNIESKLLACKTSKKEIKPLKIEIYLTRLTLSLNQSKKVDYEEALISSDYKNIYINSTIGKKYQNYAISIEEIQQLEQKSNHLYFCVMSQQVYHVIIRFKQEKQALKWSICIKYAQIIIQSKKKKDKLFEETKETPIQQIFNQNMTQTAPQAMPSPPQNSIKEMPLRTSTVKSTLGVPHIPYLNLNSQSKPISPTQSIIQAKKYGDKSFDRDQADKSGEKNTERSLVNAMNLQGYRSSKTFHNFKDTGYQKRIELTRPPNLARLRNSNSDSYSLLENAKSKLSGYRKQSQDIKPQINQIFQDQMLSKYRTKQEKEDDANSESNFRFSSPLIQKLHSNSPQKTDKMKLLQEKKSNPLKQANTISSERPAMDNKISWIGIEEMEDQNKSKSSNHVSNKSRRGSEFSEPGVIHHEILRKQIQETVSEQISEKSQEESPRLPRNIPAANLKVSYQNGMILQLHPVSPSNDSPSKQEKSRHPSSSSDSEQQQSDPSTHQNHTESQQNNAKSEQLKKGIIVTKCSEKGFWTHEKILYLSQNQSQLCSRDLKDKKIKKIKLANIKDVQYKKFDKGIIKHVLKIQQDKCMVIRALDDDNKIKNFEYVATSAQALQRFAESLKWFVEYSKQE